MEINAYKLGLCLKMESIPYNMDIFGNNSYEVMCNYVFFKRIAAKMDTTLPLSCPIYLFYCESIRKQGFCLVQGIYTY